jgi:hypothetical protein
MTTPETGTLSAVANRLHVIAGLTTERRRSALDEAQMLVELEGEVDRIVRLLRSVQPKRKDE